MTVDPSLLEQLPRLTPSDWYVVPDDIFIADIGGRALDIFPHSPESAQMTVIVTNVATCSSRLAYFGGIAI